MENGLAQCTCIEGYYRAETGEEDLPCSRESSPSLYQVDSVYKLQYILRMGKGNFPLVLSLIVETGIFCHCKVNSTRRGKSFAQFFCLVCNTIIHVDA